MSPVHLHLLLNHVSVLGTAFACLILIYGLLRGKEEVRKVALGILVIVALITPVVFFSGENSEEVVEHISGIKETSIEAHEEAAEGAYVTIEILGVLALAQLILYKFPALSKLRDRAALATVSLAVVAFLWVAYAGYLGGKIRHGEELDTALPQRSDTSNIDMNKWAVGLATDVLS